MQTQVHKSSRMPIYKAIMTGSDWRDTKILTVQEADGFQSLVVDLSTFLKQIRTVRPKGIEYTVYLADSTAHALTRTPDGEEPNTTATVTKMVRRLELRPVRLPAIIGFSFIEEHGSQAEKEIAKLLAQKFANELTELGFVGTTDTYDGTNFNTLAKGWIAIAQDTTGRPDIHRVDFSTLTTWRDKLDAVINAMPSRWYNPSKNVIIMNPTDYREFADEIGSMTGGLPYLLNPNGLKWKGHNIITVEYMPAGKVLFTRLDNIVFGMSKNIQRSREVNHFRQAVFYNIRTYIDYEFIVDDMVVFGQ